jgi:hypothetical protein
MALIQQHQQAMLRATTMLSSISLSVLISA